MDHEPRPVVVTTGASIVPREAAYGGGLGPVRPYMDADLDDEGSGGAWIAGLLRVKWLILGIFAAITLVAVPPIWIFVVPQYGATATIRVRPVQPKLIYDVGDEGTTNRNFAVYFNTLMADFTNPTILQAVLEREDVRATAWYNEVPQNLRIVLGAPPPARISRLESAILAENRPGTELLDVQVLAKLASDAQVMVNALVEEFMRFREETTEESDELRYAALIGQKESLEAKMASHVEERGNLSKQLGTDDPDIVRAQLVAQLGDLATERQRVHREYQMTLWTLEQRAAEEVAGALESADDAAGVGFPQDREWVRLNNDVENAKHAEETAAALYGEAHPELKARRATVTHAQRLLDQREAQLGAVGQAPNEMMMSGGDGALLYLDAPALQRYADQHQRKLELLDEQIADLEVEQQTKGELAKQVARLDDELRLTEGAYDQVRNRIQAIDIERKAPARISVSARALEPTAPAKDRRVLFTLAVMCAAMGTGLFVGHLRTTLDPKVHEAGDVQQAMHVPFLGQLPTIGGGRGMVPANEPLLAECIRIIRTALLERLVGSNHKVVLITSATSAAGKTTVAIALARSLAHLGKRTLLVEADLRRPTMGPRLGLEVEEGLAALLAGKGAAKHSVSTTDDPRLDVVLAGKRPEDFDPELLANGVFAACLARWRKTYDYVIVDSPPILPVADSRILAGQVDGSIMVSRSSHCRRSDVIQACADLNAAGSPLLGTVLVGVSASPRYGYSYQYSAT